MDEFGEYGLTNNHCMEAVNAYHAFNYFDTNDSMDGEEEMYRPTQNSIINTAGEEYDCWANVQDIDVTASHIEGMSSEEEHTSDQIMADTLDVYETCTFLKGKYDIFTLV